MCLKDDGLNADKDLLVELKAKIANIGGKHLFMQTNNTNLKRQIIYRWLMKTVDYTNIKVAVYYTDKERQFHQKKKQNFNQNSQELHHWLKLCQP